jgi:putative addiction module component (TIGR02574 family)
MMALTTEALRLSPEDRLKLIEEVWETFAAEPASFPVSSQELEELERRRNRYATDPDSLIDWEEMKLRLQRRRGDAH